MKYTWIFLLAVITACSPSNQNPKDEVITLEAKDGAFTGTADFGSFAHNASNAKLVTFTLKNTGTEPLAGPASLDNENEGFLISYTNCPSSLAKSKSCTLKVSFDPRNIAAGPHSANLNFDSIFVALSATKEAAPAPEVPTLTGQVQIQMAAVPVSTVDFGEITPKDAVIKTLTVKNIGSGAVLFPSVIVSSPDFTLSYDACSNKTVAKNGSCTLKVALAGSGKEGPIEATLSLEDLSVSLTGKVITPALAAQDPESSLSASIQLMDGTSVASSSKELGSFQGSQSQIVTLSAKNVGTIASVASAVGLSDSANFLLAYDACSNKALAKNATCQIKVVFSSSGKSSGDYSTILSFAGQSITLNASVSQPVPTCSGGQHLEDNVCVSNSRSCSPMPDGTTAGTQTYSSGSWGTCVASACAGTHTLSSGVCQPNGPVDYRTTDLLTPEERNYNILTNGDGVEFNLTMNTGNDYFGDPMALMSVQGSAYMTCDEYNQDDYYEVYIANDGDVEDLVNLGNALWNGGCDDSGGASPYQTWNVDSSRLGRAIYGEDMYVAIFKYDTVNWIPELVKVQTTGLRLYNTPPLFNPGYTSLMYAGWGNTYSADIYLHSLGIESTYVNYAPDVSYLYYWVDCDFSFSSAWNSNCQLNSNGEVHVQLEGDNSMCGNYSEEGALYLYPWNYVENYSAISIPISVSLPSCMCENYNNMEEDWNGHCVCKPTYVDNAGSCECPSNMMDMGNGCECDSGSGYYDDGMGSCQYMQCSDFTDEYSCQNNPIGYCSWDEEWQQCN